MRLILSILFFSTSLQLSAQFLHPSDTLNKKRLTGVIATEAVGYGSSLLLLNSLWYQYYDREKFHFFNDNPEWLQMDKAGHLMTSYYMGQVGYDVLRWSGVKKKQSLLYGATLGSFYLLSMEILDGFSSDWGFSWGDIVANTVGTGLFVSQEALWEEQKIVMKFSSHNTPYASYRPEVLGYNMAERIMKDYNGQTYWLSANVASFLPEGNTFIPWLNLAIGYSGEEMISGRTEDQGIYSGVFNRYRQYYLSLDVDFTRIPVQKTWLKPILRALNIIKIPFPALEYSSRGVKIHGLYF